MTWREWDELGVQRKRKAREARERKREGWVKFCAERGKDPGTAYLPEEHQR